MRKFYIGLGLLTLPLLSHGQATIPVKENLVVENIPALPISYVNELKNYTEFRSASIADWHPAGKEMLISTRFGNSNQLHLVKMPGGDRQQITFFDEPVSSASFEPKKGDYFIFEKDMGGNEFGQLYRYDMATKKVTLLTDGQRSQNSNVTWNHKGDRIAYGSTKRNGKDRDVYVMDPLNPGVEKKVLENAGGGWGVVDWSANDAQLLISEYLSANEGRLYLLDLATGVKTKILPTANTRATFRGVAFAPNGKGIYLTTNSEGEFNQLAYYELATKKFSFLTGAMPWDVEAASLSKDGKTLAFTTNEDGLSKLYLLNTSSNAFVPVAGIPTGVIGGMNWMSDSKTLGLNITAYNAPSDVYAYDIAGKKLTRWTESEMGGIDAAALQEPKLIKWKTFDGEVISGYLYKASPKFTGKRPVIVSIHGGPEGQSRPNFLGRMNYYLNELGISIIFPNVRGSAGYGKSFLDADNGMKREESVQDIGGLLDWIATQPDLDKDRIMVTGGSYGGYMTLAVAYKYSDKIRCALDVVGISSFTTFLTNTEAYRRDLRRVEYGDERDPAMAAFFEKISPLNHTAEIKKPMFIVQGQTDPRVPYTEAVQMKERILKQGGVVWFLMAKDEGHGFRKKDNMDYQFYATIEYIKKYLLDK